ncbi:MAG: hypothetical protein ACLTR6_06495 [Clostridium fessum]
MELMARVLRDGKQVILLIPEISLTYQTVMRFYRRFGDQIAILNSRLSAGERYDQWERAARGEVSRDDRTAVGAVCPIFQSGTDSDRRGT